MTRKLWSCSCIFLFSGIACTSKPLRAVAPPARLQQSPPVNSSSQALAAPVVVQNKVRAGLPFRPIARQQITLGYVSWSEDLPYSLSGQNLALKAELQGFQIGYVYQRIGPSLTFWLTLDLEMLQAQVSDHEVTMDFAQANVPTYAAGFGAYYAFFRIPNSVMLSLGIHLRARVINLQKISAQDDFSARQRLLPSIEMPLLWDISKNYSLAQSLGWINGPSALIWQFGLRRLL